MLLSKSKYPHGLLRSLRSFAVNNPSVRLRDHYEGNGLGDGACRMQAIRLGDGIIGRKMYGRKIFAADFLYHRGRRGTE